MAPVYRDHENALRQRLAEACQRVSELESRVTPTFWRVQAPEALRALSGLRAAAFESSLSVPERIEASGRYLERLGAMVASAADDRARWRKPPDSCPRIQPDDPTYPIGELFGASPRLSEDALTALRSRVGSIVRRLAGAHALEAFGRRGVLASFALEGAPLMLAASYGDRGGWSAAGATEVVITLRTSVAAGAGAIRLRPRGGLLHAMPFVIQRGKSGTGDPEFDGWFEVDAEPGAARLALTFEVRAALCVVARDDAPTLLVDDGVAELRWRFEPSHATVGAAVEALRGIRAAPTMPMFREVSRRGGSR